VQVIEELFVFWDLDKAEDVLEELEECLIVSPPSLSWCAHPVP
jgi:hypothetical protein